MAIPPGPRGLDVFGFFGKGSTAGMIEFLETTARRYGPISSFRILNRRLYLVDDADLIQEILVSRQHEFVRDNGAILLRELLGEAMITSEEPQHRERRRMVQPAFHRDQIAAYADIMIRHAERIASEWRDSETIDVGSEMRRMTLSIVGSTLFGADFQECAGQIAAVLRRVIRKASWLGPAFGFLEPFVVIYRRIFPNGPSLFFRSERKELERILTPVMEQRNVNGTKDVLSLLMAQHDENGAGLGADRIRNEMITFVLAGHETTAAALGWTWYLLAKHPRVDERMHFEISSVLGSRSASLDDLANLTYTSMVFREALRLYPPARVFGRRPIKTVVLGGYTIPRGASILLSPQITQRNERYFERPEAFEPERWETIAPPKFAYFPFGGGAKMCIGDSFARMEGVLAMASIARRWSFEMTSESADVRPGLTLSTSKPILLRANARVPVVPARTSEALA
jgi:cytochrome P450